MMLSNFQNISEENNDLPSLNNVWNTLIFDSSISLENKCLFLNYRTISDDEFPIVLVETNLDMEGKKCFGI